MGTKVRKRALGAGRKPLHPDGSDTVVLRIEPNLLDKIGRLAKKHGRDRSKEIRAAVRHWLQLYEKPAWHVSALTCLIAILMRRIEAHTGKRWLDDPITGAAVHQQIERLIYHFAPTPAEPVVIPPELDGVVWQLITIAENLHPRPGVPEIPAEVFGEEWVVLARIIQDLGSGWDRNKGVWQKKEGVP
jgi:hypothetical protein